VTEGSGGGARSLPLRHRQRRHRWQASLRFDPFSSALCPSLYLSTSSCCTSTSAPRSRPPPCSPTASVRLRRSTASSPASGSYSISNSESSLIPVPLQHRRRRNLCPTTRQAASIQFLGGRVRAWLNPTKSKDPLTRAASSSVKSERLTTT
jgi:hypothetical protein